MKKSIFVTGKAGSGKSKISQQLGLFGYESHDIEADKYGLFMMVRKDTGERFMDYDNADSEKVNNARWVCDLAKLKELIDKQSDDLAFYCGVASNNEKLMPLFSGSILLQASSEKLNNRLMTREGTDDYANTEAGRKKVLAGKDEFENKMIKAGMSLIDADPDPEEVAGEIIKLARSIND